jgi:signal peptidase I
MASDHTGKPRLRVNEKSSDWLTELLDWLKYILVAILLGLLLVIFVVQRNFVVGNSMLPTLQHDDQLLVEKVTKWFGGISRGDIVTIDSHELPRRDNEPNIIKRVIGVPGDKVEISAGQVYLNDQLLEEPYLAEGTVTNSRNQDYSLVILGKDEYYVLGDNRDASLDSRSFGPVPQSGIIGEVLLRFYPFDKIGRP